MKYYIPIHRDNIDNIITSECIAPMDYYPRRGYGYNYFKALKSVCNNHVLFLYDSVPEVNEPGDEDVVSYIELDWQFIKPCKTDSFEHGVIVSEPISLYPWNCRFLFQSEEALRQVVVMCKLSLCNKTWAYYVFDILEKSSSHPKNKIIESERIIRANLSSNELEGWVANNRLVGFLYAYIMGRYASLSQQLANLVQAERRIYDIATTMTGLSRYEQERYKTLLSEQERIFEQCDPQRSELQKQWNAMVVKRFEGVANQQVFVSIIRELGGEGIMVNNFARNIGFKVWKFPEKNYDKYFDWDKYKKEIEDYTLAQVMAFRIKRGDTNTKEDFVLDGRNVVTNPKYGSFYGRLITKIINGLDWFNLDNLRLHRLEFASELTRMVRDTIVEEGQEWDGSLPRVFLNDLRQHIAIGGMFDITKTSDVLLRSIAVFVLKGDDFEEMMRYMEYSAQADYRFVLGLWGACVGFADMPKTAIQRMRFDEKGEANIYLATHQLLSSAPEGVELTSHDYQIQREKDLFVSKAPTFTEVLNDKSIGLTKKQKEDILSIWKDLNENIDDTFFNRIQKIRGVGSVKLNRLKNALSVQPARNIVEPTLFPQQGDDKRFDMSAWQYIEPILPEEQIIRSKVKEDLKWFVGRIGKNETNRQIISRYQIHLLQKAHPTNPRYYWTIEYFGDLDIEKIVSKLGEVYLCS